MIERLKRLGLITVVAMTALSCESPEAEYRKVIHKYVYIPYRTALPDTRVGTIVRGNANELYVVAKPQSCFPDLPGDSALRWVQPTQLPSEYKTITFDFKSNINSVIGFGNALFSFKQDAKFVREVKMTFEGASIEFLNEFSFEEYYQTNINPRCRDFLGRHPFIIQALHVTAMEFVFRNEFNSEIKLDAEVLDDIIDIDASAKWEIKNNYTLKIETPKYIGYRLGMVDRTGRVIKYAGKTTDKGEWIFKPVEESENRFVGATPAAPLP